MDNVVLINLIIWYRKPNYCWKEKLMSLKKC